MTRIKHPWGGLARKLVQTGLLKEEAALYVTQEAKRHDVPFVSHLVSQNIIDPVVLAKFCSKEFGLPLFDLNVLKIESVPKHLIKSEIVGKHHAFPLFNRGNRLFVAITDPTNLEALDEIKYYTSIPTEAILVEEHKFNDVVSKVLSAFEAANIGELDEHGMEAIDLRREEKKVDAEEAPIVRYINKLLMEAVHTGASDLHFEPYEKFYRVRFRQDGILYENATPPVNLGPRLAARIKIMSRLDISERRVPQDGRFKMKVSDLRMIDFRISTCPTLYGEKVVMRVLDPASTKLDIDILGMEDFQKEILLKVIHKPQGMFIVTGPTGSGKTVTLYTALNILNKTERNISTCEDPVEINLQGINQVNVNIKAGLTFATALRAFLRQDPDVIMVGEIRDLETAEIAVKAAQTGHMVLSTLHTNSASDTLNRLINMGIPGYNLATSVSLIVAQRLVRKLCNECKVPLSLPEHALLEAGFAAEEIPNLKIYGPHGCELCKEGYKGRMAIYEMLLVSDEIGNIIMSGGNAIEISKQALKEGMWDLRRSGLHKIRLGLTSLDELNRVITE